MESVTKGKMSVGKQPFNQFLDGKIDEETVEDYIYVLKSEDQSCL